VIAGAVLRMGSDARVISIQAKFLSLVLRLSNLKKSLDKALDYGSMATGKSSPPPKSMFLNFDIENTQSCGRNVYTLRPKTGAGNRHIFYLHGGAYILGFNRLHWSYIARLIQSTGCTIVAPDYPLAPEYTWSDSFRMVEPIYRDLVARVGGENVVLMGDSAGGGFALALAQKMKQESVGPARQIILLSPWLDIALDNQDIADLVAKDPILEVRALKRAGRCYAGDSSLSSFLVSPINGDMHGLGEISLFVGTHDIMLADARRLRTMAKDKGISISFFEYEGMLHVWMLFNLPESKKALDQVVGLLGRETT